MSRINKALSIINKIRKLQWLRTKASAGLLIFSFILTPLYFLDVASADSNSKKKEITEKQLKSISSEIKKIQKNLGLDKDSQKKEQLALKQTELEINILHKENRRLSKQEKKIKGKIFVLKADENKLLTKNKQQQLALASDLRNLYKIGRQEKLKLLLNQENPEDIARILKYYDYYSLARVNRIKAFQTTIGNLQGTRVDIETELNELKVVKSETVKQQNKLKLSQVKRESVLVTLKKDIQSQGSKLKNLQSDQSRLSKLLSSLKDVWSEIPSRLSETNIKKRKGKLKRPTKGRVRNKFGANRAGGRLRWNGIFIEANEGNEVQAIHGGRVVFSDWLRGYGLLIIVDHNKGYLSLYGHNASLYKETGDWISAGDTLASVGNSGGYKTTGLYFELRKDGKPINPKSWLKK